MEGIGYWIFLMLLYFISGLMKKRKNKSIFKEMEKKDHPHKSKIEGILDYLTLNDFLAIQGNGFSTTLGIIFKPELHP